MTDDDPLNPKNIIRNTTLDGYVENLQLDPLRERFFRACGIDYIRREVDLVVQYCLRIHDEKDIVRMIVALEVMEADPDDLLSYSTPDEIDLDFIDISWEMDRPAQYLEDNDYEPIEVGGTVFMYRINEKPTSKPGM
jgi:hypothetical protein